MTDKERAQLTDMKAFIQYGLDESKDFKWVLSNLGHDVGGLIREERNFLPRSDGYGQMMKIREDAS